MHARLITINPYKQKNRVNKRIQIKEYNQKNMKTTMASLSSFSSPTTLILGNYKLDLAEVITSIQQTNAKRVVLQLPDGFKYHAKTLVDFLKSHCSATHFYVWLGSNYGSCDLPLGLEKVKIDIIVHLGHAQWR